MTNERFNSDPQGPLDSSQGPLKSGPLRELLTWWVEARAGARLPPRSAVDPLAFPHALPVVWLCDWDRTQRSGRLRLAGDDIERLYGRPLKGAWLEATAGESEPERVLQIYRRVAEEPCLYRSRGHVYRIAHDLYGDGERLILPLAEDGRTVSHLIGATVFRLTGTPIDPEALPDTGHDADVRESFAPPEAAEDWLRGGA